MPPVKRISSHPDTFQTAFGGGGRVSSSEIQLEVWRYGSWGKNTILKGKVAALGGTYIWGMGYSIE